MPRNDVILDINGQNTEILKDVALWFSGYIAANPEAPGEIFLLQDILKVLSARMPRDMFSEFCYDFLEQI